KANMATAGIYLNWDILNKKASGEIQKAQVERLKSALEIAKTKKDLQADINKINQTLKEINEAIKYTKESIKTQKELLVGATAAFKLSRMSVDEYLQYEDNLAKSRANLANLYALKNSYKAQKCLIYGINLKRIFK
ncbi:MAG: TolC family protein, partial [Epsilonproteobacteria bacterium]|nr:TolC family protein [Campylobacterota bacterium]